MGKTYKEKNGKNNVSKNVNDQTFSERMSKEIHAGNQAPSPVTLVKPSNPYRIVGTARASKSGASLTIRLLTDKPKEYEYLTISRKDLISIFTDESGLSVCDVRKYDNPTNNSQGVN
jgi:hypothetical protein